VYIQIVGIVKEGIIVKFGIKILIKKLIKYLGIATQLHSKAPNKEIKRIWEIIAFGVMFILLMNIICGIPIIPFLNFTFKFPFSQMINYYGGLIFFFFVILFIIFSLDLKKPELKV
jgi:hypothetical protein